ncbi:MAG: His/Gly/Thr/Pro-type tRNA ligase C-terminal domain-containing protein [Waddliaceae bacterium]
MDLNARRTAAHFLAYSLSQLFPETKVLDSGVNHLGFFCTFSCKGGVEEIHFPVIEEKMYEPKEIRQFEMVYNNCLDFLRDQGEKFLISRIPHTQTVTLVQIHHFFDLSEGELLEEMPAFSLQRLEKTDDQVYTISGFAATSKHELKQFLKLWRKWKKNDPIQMMSQLELMKFDGVRQISYPKGELLKSLLISLWEKKTQVEKNHVMGDGVPDGTDFGFWREERGDRWHEEIGFLNPPYQTRDSIILQSSAESVISFLQLINEMYNIFNCELSYYLVSKRSKKKIALDKWNQKLVPGAKILGCVTDSLGREWSLSAIEAEESNRVRCSLFVCLERLIAFLLSQNEGWLPLVIAPVQMRVIPVDKQAKKKAYELKSQLPQLRIEVDEQSCELQQKVSQARISRIPYLVIIGKSELESGCLTISSFGQEKRELVFEQLLKEVNEQLEN